MMPNQRNHWGLISIACLLLVAGCSTPTSSPPTSTTVLGPTPTAPMETPTAATEVLPTATTTPEPLAALVNGTMITLAEYQSELARFRQAVEDGVGTELATFDSSEEMIVLDDLIDQVLLAQEAETAGFLVDDAMLDQKIADLAGQVELDSWIAGNGYSTDTFRQAMRRAVLSAYMRDQVYAQAPNEAEQVHARQILLYNAEEANQIYVNLQNGADFGAVAALYDPDGGGDLGWFPRGALTQVAVEQAAFEIQPGEFSSVIETPIGFHIVQVIERDTGRFLEPDARRLLQAQELEHWLELRRSESEIKVLVP